MTSTTDTHTPSKQSLYADVTQQIAATIGDESNVTARIVTTIALLHHHMDYFFWTGVYLVDPMKNAELVIGPYQGTLGCLRIAFGKGVCGAAAAQGRTICVDDVHAFEGHIACDSRSMSEIVVPIYAPDGTLFGVLDVDSTAPSSFCEIDQINLELIVSSLII